MRNIVRFSIAIALLTSLILLLMKHFPHSLDSDQNKISLITSFIIISLFLMRMITHKPNFTIFIKQFSGWVLISLLALTGYSYQYELKQYSNRLTANVLPGYGQGNGDGSVTYYAGDDGHFIVTSLINDEDRVRFMLDTGASMVSLTKEDAKNIGINVETLNYNTPLSTANGTSWGATVKLDKMQVGPIIIYNIEATVSDGGLDTSLLGMSFLRQLKQFSVKGNILTLVN